MMKSVTAHSAAKESALVSLLHTAAGPLCRRASPSQANCLILSIQQPARGWFSSESIATVHPTAMLATVSAVDA